jgi:hypothetical protein
MDIDVDWCLTCQKHIEGDYPYCSPDCKNRATPPAITFTVHNDHHDDDRFRGTDAELTFYAPSSSSTTSRWLGNDVIGIAAWAADIPPNAPPPADDIPPPQDRDRTHRPPTLHKSHRAPPKLLKSCRLIAPPCLSTSSTYPAESCTSSPIITPSRPSSTGQPQTSLSKTSSKSSPTESPVSTPPSSPCQPAVPIFCPSRKSSILDDMYIQVRSWVSPTPPLFVPVELPYQKRPPLPVNRVDSSKFKSTARPLATKFLAYENHLGRGRQLAINDEPPSFRTRGRKASRVAT